MAKTILSLFVGVAFMVSALVFAVYDPVGEAPVATVPSPQPTCAALNESSFVAFRGGLSSSVVNIQSLGSTLQEWWFVAGQVQTVDVDPAQNVGIWAVEEDPADRIVDEFVAVNNAALVASDWPTAPETVSLSDPAIDRLFDCVGVFPGPTESPQD